MDDGTLLRAWHGKMPHYLRNTWQIEEEQEVAEMRQRAERGDADAMHTLGIWYRDGLKSLPQSDKKAFRWLKLGADRLHPGALTDCAVAYASGQGVFSDQARALVLLGQASIFGSEHACYLLGWAFRDGHFGVARDLVEASRWFDMMQRCTITNTSPEMRDDASEWLRDNPAQLFRPPDGLGMGNGAGRARDILRAQQLPGAGRYPSPTCDSRGGSPRPPRHTPSQAARGRLAGGRVDWRRERRELDKWTHAMHDYDLPQ